jgi:hypothetical protein
MARKRFQRGSLKKRVGKRSESWVVQWREDQIENGQVLRRFRKETWPIEEFPTRKLALREIERRLASINSPSYRPTHKMLFADFAQRWTDTVLPMHKPSSQNSEKAHLKCYIRPFFDSMYLHEITPMHVQKFVASLRNAPKTVRNIYATFRSMWKLGKGWGVVERNVCEGIKMPRLNPVERPTFTIEQMQQIIQAAEEPFKTFFWLASETGMRAGELIGLRICDVDISRCQVSVRQSLYGTARRDRQSLWLEPGGVILVSGSYRLSAIKHKAGTIICPSCSAPVQDDRGIPATLFETSYDPCLSNLESPTQDSMPSDMVMPLGAYGRGKMSRLLQHGWDILTQA